MSPENINLLIQLDTIDDLVMESEMSVIDALMYQYEKCELLLEYAPDSPMLDELDIFIQEGAMDNVKNVAREGKFVVKNGINNLADKGEKFANSKTEGNLAKRIGLGIVKSIVKLFVKVVRFFQRLNSKKVAAQLQKNAEEVKKAEESLDDILGQVDAAMGGGIGAEDISDDMLADDLPVVTGDNIIDINAIDNDTGENLGGSSNSNKITIDGEEFDFGEREDLGEEYAQFTDNESEIYQEGIAGAVGKAVAKKGINELAKHIDNTDLSQQLQNLTNQKKKSIALMIRKHDKMTPAEKKMLMTQISNKIDHIAYQYKNKSGSALDTLEKIVVANLKDPNAPSKVVIQNIENKLDKLGDKIETGAMKAGDAVGYLGKGAIKAVKIASKSMPEIRKLTETVVKKTVEIGKVAADVSSGAIQANETVKAISNIITKNEGVIGTLTNLKKAINNLSESYENTTERQRAEIKRLLQTTIKFSNAFNKSLDMICDNLNIEVKYKSRQLTDKANDAKRAIKSNEKVQMVVSIADDSVKALAVKVNQSLTKLSETYETVRVSDEAIKSGINTLKEAVKEANNASADYLAGAAKYLAGRVIEMDSIEKFLQELGNNITEIGKEMEAASQKSAAFIQDEEMMSSYSQCMTQLYSLAGKLTQISGFCVSKSVSNPTNAKKLFDKALADTITAATGVKTKDENLPINV